MVREFDAIAAGLVHDGMRQGRPVQLLGSKGTFAVDTNTLDESNDVVDLLQGLYGGYTNGQMMKAHVAATIKGSCVVVRLPQGDEGFSVRDKRGWVGFAASDFFESNGFEKGQGSVNVRDGEADVRNSNGQRKRRHDILCLLW